MSFYVEAIGDKPAVKAKVAADSNVPAPVKAAVASVVDLYPDEYNDHIVRSLYVKAQGHIDQNHGGEATITVKSVAKA